MPKPSEHARIRLHRFLKHASILRSSWSQLLEDVRDMYRTKEAGLQSYGDRQLLVLRRRDRYEQQGGRCIHCRRRVRQNRATAEHVVPRSKGGLDGFQNLLMNCWRCNQRRGNGTMVLPERFVGDVTSKQLKHCEIKYGYKKKKLKKTTKTKPNKRHSRPGNRTSAEVHALKILAKEQGEHANTMKGQIGAGLAKRRAQQTKQALRRAKIAAKKPKAKAKAKAKSRRPNKKRK